MTATHVPGKKSHDIMLYALSTCGWCHKTKHLLDELGVEYDYEYVDRLVGEERSTTMRTIARWNPACNFPTLVVDYRKCIVGFEEAKIREAVAE